MWTIIIIIIFDLWLLGAFGGNVVPNLPKTGNWVYSLIQLVVISSATANKAVKT